MISAVGALALMALCLVLGGVMVHLHYQRLGRVYLEGQQRLERVRQQAEALEREKIRLLAFGGEPGMRHEPEPAQLGAQEWNLLQSAGGVKMMRRRNT